MNEIFYAQFKDVEHFNKSFGLPAYETLQIDIFKRDPKLVNFRYSLIKEEICELIEAVQNYDMKEVIDAVGDILYVAWGAYSSLGINILKIKKLVEYSISNKYSTIQYDIFKQNPDFGLDLIKANLLKLEKAINDHDMDNLTDAIAEIICGVYDIGSHFGIDLKRAFDLVHQSNMTKLCISEEEAKKTVKWYKENESRYDSPAYRQSDDEKYWVVYNESTSKILKNVNYKPVDFSEMLDDQKDT